MKFGNDVCLEYCGSPGQGGDGWACIHLENFHLGFERRGPLGSLRKRKEEDPPI